MMPGLKKDDISVLEIDNIFDAEEVVRLLEERKISIISTFNCISDTYQEGLTCKVLLQHHCYEIGVETLRVIEGGLPILY